MRVNRPESAERVDAAVRLRPGLAGGRIGIRTSLEVLKNACQFGTRRWCVSVSDVDAVRPMSVPAAQATVTVAQHVAMVGYQELTAGRSPCPRVSFVRTTGARTAEHQHCGHRGAVNVWPHSLHRTQSSASHVCRRIIASGAVSELAQRVHVGEVCTRGAGVARGGGTRRERGCCMMPSSRSSISSWNATSPATPSAVIVTRFDS